MAGKNQEKTQPIIIKRKKAAHGHHGGAWKIAYADFVTAMMAFFLLMWLLGSTTKGELMGISEYFQTPLQVALFGGSGSGDSSSLIKGGGTDLTRRSGQVKKGDVEEQKKIISMRAAKVELDLPSRIDEKLDPRAASRSNEQQSSKEAAEKADIEALQGLKARIESLINTSPALIAFKSQLLLELVDEGLRIQIIDAQNRPMFDLSSTQLKGYAQEILREIGLSLNDVPNRLTISGHTDALPYKAGEKGYSNWELSSERANAARREMARGGMSDAKVLRVVGHGSAVPFNRDDPDDPANRRISIVVLKRSSEERALLDSLPSAQIKTAAQAREQAQSLPAEPAKPLISKPNFIVLPPPPPRTSPSAPAEAKAPDMPTKP